MKDLQETSTNVLRKKDLKKESNALKPYVDLRLSL